MLSINQSRDPSRWGSRSKSWPLTQRVAEDSAPPGSGGQRKERGLYEVDLKKQQQELLKAPLCLDITADRRPCSALGKQASVKTLRIGFHGLFRLWPWQHPAALLPRFPPLSNAADLCCCSSDPALTSNRRHETVAWAVRPNRCFLGCVSNTYKEISGVVSSWMWKHETNTRFIKT